MKPRNRIFIAVSSIITIALIWLGYTRILGTAGTLSILTVIGLLTAIGLIVVFIILAILTFFLVLINLN